MNRGLKGVFCYDEPLLIDEQGSYNSYMMSSQEFEKYFQLVDSLVLCMPTETVALSEQQTVFSEFNENRFELKPVPNLSTLKGSLRKRRQWKKELENVLEEADILIVRLPSYIGYMAIDVARSIGKPYLVEVVDCAWSTHWHQSGTRKLAALSNFYMMRRRVRKASHVMYETEQFLQQRYPSNGSMLSCADVHLPDSDELVHIQRDVKIARRHLREPIILGTVVDLKQKAHLDVLEAIACLEEEGYRFRYKIVGDDLQLLRKHVERLDLLSEVEFLEPLTQHELVTFFDEIDVYIQSSGTDGLPKLLLKAMSRGCPAIGIDVGSIPELLESRAIYRVGDTKGLSRILRESIEKDWMYDMAKANIKKARSYESERLAVIREACYAEVRSVCFGK